MFVTSQKEFFFNVLRLPSENTKKHSEAKPDTDAMDDETKNGTNDEVADKSELEVALESDDKTDHIYVHEKMEIFNEEEGNDAVVIMRDKHEEYDKDVEGDKTNW